MANDLFAKLTHTTDDGSQIALIQFKSMLDEYRENPRITKELIQETYGLYGDDTFFNDLIGYVDAGGDTTTIFNVFVLHEHGEETRAIYPDQDSIRQRLGI